MTVRNVIRPQRHSFKPVLSDESVMDVEGAPLEVFLAPSSRWIARYFELIIAAGAGAALLIAWLISLADGPEPLENLFIVLAFAIAGVPAIPEVWRKVSRLRIDIDVLMLLGAGLAAYVRYPFEGAMLLFLFALAGGLEQFALGRTQRAITALRKLSPKEATLIENQKTRRVPLQQVAIGARVLVRPGEKIPLDGEVVGGASSVNEAAITGESIPRECLVGDTVFAGTQNLDGRLEVRVSRRAGDTTLAKIVELVTKARHHPAQTQRLIDRVGPAYSAVVVAAAVLTGLIGATIAGLEGSEAARRAIAVLIVASPCALIIATPVAYLSAIAASARRGVLVKGGAHLETVARTKVFAFDKTGTLTTGRVRLAGIEFDASIGEAEALRIAGALEASSSHPLAAAVMDALAERGLNPYSVTDYRNLPGEGESGVVEGGRRVWIGRPERMAEQMRSARSSDSFPSSDHQEAVDRLLRRTEELRREGKTVSALLIDNAAGLLAFEDTLRDHAAECIQRLRDHGAERIEMLTGDHEAIARRVAEKLKLDGAQAELRPQDKLDAIERLRARYGPLVLVGDGINDAPALAHADVGIAMGSMGADVALEAAHIVVMKDRIERVAWLHRHALRTAGIVRQNVTLAIGVIAVLSVFAVLGNLALPLAVVGHEGSTVLVAVNALRLLHTPQQ